MIFSPFYLCIHNLAKVPLAKGINDLDVQSGRFSTNAVYQHTCVSENEEIVTVKRCQRK